MVHKPEKEALVTKRSIEVLKDCCRANGAIIAANPENPSYPKDVQPYNYVWPRDAAYICLALTSINEFELQLKYFDWLKERAEGIEKGLIHQNYYQNGRKRWLGFQPDQAGITLIAIADLMKKGKADAKTIKLAEQIADAIAELWQRDHFKFITQDLWEEFYCYPEMKQCFTYSAAIVGAGLRDIGPLIKKDYRKIYSQMFELVKSAYQKEEKLFLKRTGLNTQKRVDASILGIVWPANIGVSMDFLDKIAERLKHEKGIMRYEYDDYDGFRHEGNDARRGAGAWPILTFWLSIAYKKAGNDKKARAYYDLALNCADENGYLPEQSFSNNIQSSVKPLAWSHAMQILAKDILNEKSKQCY